MIKSYDKITKISILIKTIAFPLQEAMESAEVNKMDLLRTVDGTVIYEDSNSQPQNQVRNQLYPLLKVI